MAPVNCPSIALSGGSYHDQLPPFQPATTFDHPPNGGVVSAHVRLCLRRAGDLLTADDFNLPPQDADGWSILTPAADSRLIYVDSQSNDSTGTHYSPSSPQIGPDPTRPVGAVLAFRTLEAAATRLREDSPDWMLLRAGRVWTESLPSRRGRSRTERAVITAWGEGPRPELRTGAGRGMRANQPVNLAVVGIRFWAHTRDSSGPYFTGYAGQTGMSFNTSYAGDPRQVRNVLIED